MQVTEESSVVFTNTCDNRNGTQPEMFDSWNALNLDDFEDIRHQP